MNNSKLISGIILETAYLPTAFAYEIEYRDDEHRKCS